MPVVETADPGVASSRATCLASFSGSHSSSSSQKATSSPVAARMPLLRAPARPGVRWLRIVTRRRPGGSSGQGRSGSLWSNTTTHSTGPR